MSRRTLILLAVGVPVAALLAVLVWASARTGGQPRDIAVYSTFGQAVVEERPAPDFTLPLLDGGAVTLSQLRGKVVMVYFWASWCPSCRQETALLAKTYLYYRRRGVEFIGVAIWDRREDVLAYVEKYGIPFPTGLDAQGTIAIDYGVTGVPEKYFVDRQGRLVRKFIGPVSEKSLTSVLEELLADG